MKKLILLFVVVSLATAPVLLAQPQFQQVIEVRVEPGQERAYENFVKKVVEAANKVESPVSWSTFFATVGKPGSTYRIAISFEKWAERDQWMNLQEVLTKAFGEQEAERLLREGRAGVASSRSRIWERLDDGSSNPRAGDQPANFYDVRIRRVKPEMLLEYRALQRKWKAAHDAANNSVTRWVLRYGDGPGATFRRTEPFDTWTELDGWGDRQTIRKHYGDEEADLIRKTNRGAVWERERFVSAYRPDLSRRAGGGPTSE
jgi:antibiotic biosynthesis monooxygenase (ABM) superfamily enzyme